MRQEDKSAATAAEGDQAAERDHACGCRGGNEGQDSQLDHAVDLAGQARAELEREGVARDGDDVAADDVGIHAAEEVASVVGGAARAEAMNRANPLYVLRNHLAQQAIAQAELGDFSEVDRLFKVLARPFEEQPGMETYAEAPPEGTPSIEVSCSS